MQSSLLCWVTGREFCSPKHLRLVFLLSSVETPSPAHHQQTNPLRWKNSSSYFWLTWELAEPGSVDWLLIWNDSNKNLHWVSNYLLSADINWPMRVRLFCFTDGLKVWTSYLLIWLPILQYGQFLILNLCARQQFKAKFPSQDPIPRLFPWVNSLKA